MDRARIEREVCEVIGAVLQQGGPVPGDSRRDGLGAWDSLKHVEVMFALEDHFQVRFSEADLEGLDGVPAIVSRLEPLLGP